jgi:type I restriction enzyme S subunit
VSFSRYPAYKPSGVEWLGDVPEHWKALPLRRLIRQVTSGTSVNAIDEPASHGQAGVLKTSCVYTGEFRPEENKAILESELDRATCPVVAGTLVVSRMNTPDLVGSAGLVKNNDPYLFLPDRLWLVSFQDCDPQFMNYWCKSVSYRSQVQLACSGTSSSMQNLSQDNFYSFIAPLPPTGEQSAIATFLDRETAKIDALIAEQQRLIELLQEKRQAVISHAVTKGLNPNAPMKDSGVEWLGEVPKHWSIKRLKHISPRLTVGIVVNPSSYISDDGLPFIYGGDIREGIINWQGARRIKAEHSDEQAKTRLVAGDLLMVRVGAPGITAVVPLECEGGNCASVMLIRGGDFSSNWLCYALNTRIVRFQVEVVQYGAAQEQFNIGHAVDFSVPVPPREEQEEIALALACQTQAIDSLIAQSEKGISLLEERRSALISAAVTGQIDVQGLAETETDKR